MKLRAQALVAEITAPILPVIGPFAVKQIGESMERFVNSIVDFVDASACQGTPF